MVRNIKVYSIEDRLSAEYQANLLRFIARYTAVHVLEIGTLNLLENHRIELFFDQLTLLSIDAIRGHHNLDAYVNGAKIRIEAPELKAIYPGEYFLNESI